MTAKNHPERLLLPLAILVATLLLLAATLAPAAPAQARGQDTQCGRGEVQSALQALPVGLYTVPQGKAGLGGGATNCRYSVWPNPDTDVYFTSSDHILGAVVNFIPLELLDVSPQEAVEILQTAEDRVFLKPAGAPDDQYVEQQLTATVFKSMNHPDFGHIVYQTKGFITQLEPGDYTSRYEWRWPIFAGDDDLHVDIVTLHIAP